jgi:hypothetical protein
VYVCLSAFCRGFGSFEINGAGGARELLLLHFTMHTNRGAERKKERDFSQFNDRFEEMRKRMSKDPLQSQCSEA